MLRDDQGLTQSIDLAKVPERCEQEPQLKLVGRLQEEGSEEDEKEDISLQGQKAC